MSDENVEFARTGYAVLNEVYKTGDLDALTTHIANTIDPDCVLVASDVTFQGEWYGREGMVEFIADQMDALDDLWVQPEEYIALDDRLIVPITWGGRAKETQIDVEFASVHVYRIRDGKATRIDMHSDKAAALGAVHAEIPRSPTRMRTSLTTSARPIAATRACSGNSALARGLRELDP
jgi:ketosteroid isomerase-like protein